MRNVVKERKREEDLRSRFDIDNLPPLLVEALSNLVTTDFSYEEETRIYNEQQFALATNYIPAVPPGNLAHQDISCHIKRIVSLLHSKNLIALIIH